MIYAPELRAERAQPAVARGTGPVLATAPVYQPEFAPDVIEVAARQQERAPGYGGGFIEFLFTGRGDPGTMQRPAANRSWGAQSSRNDVSDPRWNRSGGYDSRASSGFDPRFERQFVDYSGPYGPGTVVIDTENRFLFLVQPGGKAIRYGVGVGRPGFLWHGVKEITAKREWPDWRPPAEMLKRRPDLPVFMAGGPDNPLGARAMYLGSSMYRIHGSNEPETIGHAVSSGCIRMRNEDVIDLYGRVKVGTKVVAL
ncbi:L,D-transpeptidase [Blastochloris sulfoviridis]|uniref:L,D-transpeptidase n=1 Tax=Blastochloris sulfoviridis TaxID=50712 RepID=A0A5M6I1F7_9HYPH|nr:L,D-transpeptidase [Blastochloris sulfoviridis]KAA5602024.1 L,D-transpeptidase [Blastochloris sulfoviridis]